jgi:prephenate dehydratase
MPARADAGAGRRTVAFLGPAGTFSEEALLSSAEPGAVEPVPQAGIYESVMALRRGEVDWSLVPIENSLEGSINVTLDLLAGEAADVRIVGEALLRVRHCLIAAADVPLGEIETVVSHPQVPGQCARFLRGELPQAAFRPANSTAEAVRLVVGGSQTHTAALGTALAAEIYGGVLLREGVEDRPDNQTRFVWLARHADGALEAPLRGRVTDEERRCSIVFWGAGADHPGWLVRCLGVFADRGINLTKIESRPRREELGAYMFFAELAGDEHDAVVTEALTSLRELCESVLVLGSYAAAGAARSAPA